MKCLLLLLGVEAVGCCLSLVLPNDNAAAITCGAMLAVAVAIGWWVTRGK